MLAAETESFFGKFESLRLRDDIRGLLPEGQFLLSVGELRVRGKFILSSDFIFGASVGNGRVDSVEVVFQGNELLFGVVVHAQTL